MAANRVALYASVGPELTHYDVDVEAATLTRRGTVTLPANVHYCWPHASRPILYVASSNSASGVGAGRRQASRDGVASIRRSGALSPHGDPIALPTRPIHMTTDIPSEHLLVAFSNPSGIRVYRVNPDVTPGEEVEQPEPIDPGIYGHQVRVSPDNRLAILVTRGHDAAGGKPEEPGALKVFGYRDGRLSERGIGRAERRLRVRAAPPRFSSDRALGLCLARAAEQARHVRIRRRTARCRPSRLPQDTLAEPRQYPRPAGRRHGARASERALCLRRQPRLLDGRGRAASGSLPAARTRSPCMGSIPRPASRTRSSTSTRAASIAGPSTSTRAGVCWWPRTSWRCRYGTAAASAPCRRAWRCSGSAAAAGSTSSANTMSMSATGRCCGWAWWRCSRHGGWAVPVALSDRTGFSAEQIRVELEPLYEFASMYICIA